MKNFYQFIFTTLMYCVIQLNLSAQCTNIFQYPPGIILVPTEGLEQTIVSNSSYPGDYFIVKQVEIGKNYQFTSSVETDYYSVYNQSQSLVAHGTQPLTVLGAVSMDSLFVHINLNASCDESSDIRTTQIICLDCPAPGVGIGTLDPHNSAILDIQSNSQGMLMPRMTMAERDNILNPAQGLLIFNLDARELNFYDAITNQWIDPVSDEDLVPILGQISANSNLVSQLINDSVTVIKNISYHAFTPPQNSIEMFTSTTTGKWVTEGSVLYAPLQIPKNSVIKQMTLYYYDFSNSTTGHFFLNQSNLTSNSAPVQVDYLNTSGNSPSVEEVSKSMNYTIENDYSYYLGFTNYNDSNVRIKGARIAYKIRVYNN